MSYYSLQGTRMTVKRVQFTGYSSACFSIQYSVFSIQYSVLSILSTQYSVLSTQYSVLTQYSGIGVPLALAFHIITVLNLQLLYPVLCILLTPSHV